jgi:hypothetical protein
MHPLKIGTLVSRMQKYNNSTNPYLKFLFPDKIHKLTPGQQLETVYEM